MKKLNHKGFGAVGAIIIAGIILVIGGTGFFVYNSRKKPNATPETTATVDTKEEPQNTETVKTEEKPAEPQAPPKTTTAVYVNGASFELPNSMGTLLTYAMTKDRSSLSSSSLLAKEKELHGDSNLDCLANDFALGRITVKEESAPFPNDTLIKKLDTGKYLFYADDSHSSACYNNHNSLRSLVDEQVTYIKEALKTAR